MKTLGSLISIPLNIILLIGSMSACITFLFFAVVFAIPAFICVAIGGPSAEIAELLWDASKELCQCLKNCCRHLTGKTK